MEEGVAFIIIGLGSLLACALSIMVDKGPRDLEDMLASLSDADKQVSRREMRQVEQMVQQHEEAITKGIRIGLHGCTDAGYVELPRSPSPAPSPPQTPHPPSTTSEALVYT